MKEYIINKEKKYSLERKIYSSYNKSANDFKLFDYPTQIPSNQINSLQIKYDSLMSGVELTIVSGFVGSMLYKNNPLVGSFIGTLYGIIATLLKKKQNK